MWCIYLTEEDRSTYRELIHSDEEFKEIFKEALSYAPSLMIKENKITEKGNIFRKSRTYIEYALYMEMYSKSGRPMYQAQVLRCGSGTRDKTAAYLFGLVNAIR